jgi:hypothetical protein
VAVDLLEPQVETPKHPRPLFMKYAPVQEVLLPGHESELYDPVTQRTPIVAGSVCQRNSNGVTRIKNEADDVIDDK